MNKKSSTHSEQSWIQKCWRRNLDKNKVRQTFHSNPPSKSSLARTEAESGGSFGDNQVNETEGVTAAARFNTWTICIRLGACTSRDRSRKHFAFSSKSVQDSVLINSLWLETKKILNIIMHCIENILQNTSIIFYTKESFLLSNMKQEHSANIIAKFKSATSFDLWRYGKKIIKM